jgi:hypothetical protein
LHLGEKEILDKKVNCGERSEDYGNNDSAPEQGLAPAHRCRPSGFVFRGGRRRWGGFVLRGMPAPI